MNNDCAFRGKEWPVLDLLMILMSNVYYLLNAGNQHESDTKLTMSSNLSYATNCNASSRALTLSGGSMLSDLSFGSLMHMGYSNGFCHSNVNGIQSFINCFPYLSINFLLHIMKHNNHDNHQNSPCVIQSLLHSYMMNNVTKFRDFIPHPGLDINRFRGMKNPVFACSSFCPNDSIRGITSGRVNKHCLCKSETTNVMIRAPKRPRVSPSLHVHWVRKPPQQELLLFKDAKNFSALEIPTDGEEKDESDTDVSLHL